MTPSRSYGLDEDNPSALNLFFTGRCNLNCRYCFVNRANVEHMTVDERSLKRSVDVLFAHPGRIKRISFKGGEPLIEFPLVRRVYDYALQEAGRKQIILDGSVVTNGTLLNQEMVDYFIKSKISVVVSIDGAQTSQDRNRPFKGSSIGSSFDKIIKNIDKISFGSLKLIASMVFTPENINNLIENIRFLNGKNFYCIEFYPDLYAEWTAQNYESVRNIFQEFEVYYTGLFKENGKVFKNHLVDRVVNGHGGWKTFRCGEVHLNPESEYYVCDKVFSLEPVERRKYVIGNAERGIDEQKRKEMLRQLCEDFAAESEFECSECLFQKYCFCPIGHHIYASDLKAKHQKKQSKNLYDSFCCFSKIYSEVFLRIKSALRYNPRFIELYQFIAAGG